MRLVILIDMFLNLSFNMTTSFANVARTASSTSKNLYTRKDFKSSEIGSLKNASFKKTRRLKNVVIFAQTILRFVLSRKIKKYFKVNSPFYLVFKIYYTQFFNHCLQIMKTGKFFKNLQAKLDHWFISKKIFCIT